MTVLLQWVFTNGHTWEKTFDTEQAAEEYTHLCDMYRNPAVDKVWYTVDNTDTWLKEKTA